MVLDFRRVVDRREGLWGWIKEQVNNGIADVKEFVPDLPAQIWNRVDGLKSLIPGMGVRRPKASGVMAAPRNPVCICLCLSVAHFHRLHARPDAGNSATTQAAAGVRCAGDASRVF
jgi:hypothetical protein